MFCRYILQRRQRHDSGFHSLISIFKLSIDSLFLKSFGRLSNIFGPKNLILSKPLFIDLTVRIIKSLWFLRKYYPWSFSWKTSCMIPGDVFVYTLNTWIASACLFLWCIETDLSFTRNPSKDEHLSL